MSLRPHSAPFDVAKAGDSLALELLKSQIVTAAQCDLPVLIMGESGTGKEAIARAIHRQSARRSRPFISINCGSLSGTLLEEELFGYRHANNRTKKGLFEIAHRGTIFLNEVEELSRTSQARLLHALEGKPALPDARVKKPIDARVISASDHNLLEEITAGKFRQALFYRLAVLMIRTAARREYPDRLIQAMPFIADSFRENDSLDGYLDRTLLAAYDHFRALTGSHSQTARLFQMERVALYQRIARARRRVNGGTASEDTH